MRSHSGPFAKREKQTIGERFPEAAMNLNTQELRSLHTSKVAQLMTNKSYRHRETGRGLDGRGRQRPVATFQRPVELVFEFTAPYAFAASAFEAGMQGAFLTTPEKLTLGNSNRNSNSVCSPACKSSAAYV